MDPYRKSRAITSPAEMRATARRGEWRGSTGGHCPACQQANLVILPKEAAAEFARLLHPQPQALPDPRDHAPGLASRTHDHPRAGDNVPDRPASRGRHPIMRSVRNATISQSRPRFPDHRLRSPGDLG
jgi:uncharacterized protein YcsI (UPF0317 family)